MLKRNVSKLTVSGMRKSTQARIGSLLPKMSYHLHALASDVKFVELELPLVVPEAPSPVRFQRLLVRVITSRVNVLCIIQADPVQWDPEGEATTGSFMSSANHIPRNAPRNAPRNG